MLVRVVQGSIGDADVDVLVNASNTVLRLGTGVSAAIRESCGSALVQELDALRQARPQGWEPGTVVMTTAGDHRRAKHVAHVTVMDYRDTPGARPRPDLERIRRGSVALWVAIDALGSDPLSVGMVALGAGTGGLGLRDSIRIACETLKESSPKHIGAVTFVAYQLHELINTAAVVRDHFDLPLDDFEPEMAAMIEKV